MSKASRINFTDIKTTLDLLLEAQQYTQIGDVLTRALPFLQNRLELEQILKLLQRIPKECILAVQSCRLVYTNLQCELGFHQELEQFMQQAKPHCSQAEFAQITVEYAGGLALQQEFIKAISSLEPILEWLDGEYLGRAYALLGYARFELSQPKWEADFLQAKRVLEGIWLARTLINYGFCLSESGADDLALKVWQEALPLLKHRPKTIAHVLYNLGVVAARNLLSEAEGFFAQLERVAQHQEVAISRAAAWNGIALSRRIRGEWKRAEAAYRHALRLADEPFERRTALRGLARVYLLTGRAALALETLEYAISEQLENDALHLAHAQTLLALSRSEEARASVAKIRHPDKTSLRVGVLVVRAELARLDGDLDTAKTLLASLGKETLLVKEEARQWQELWRMTAVDVSNSVPPRTNIIRLETFDEVRVFLNNREITLPPRAKELLAYLSWHKGEMSLEDCLADIIPADVTNRLESLENAVALIRKMFGFRQVIVRLKKHLQLDKHSVWLDQVHGEPTQKTYMLGFERGWVLAARERLLEKQKTT